MIKDIVLAVCFIYFATHLLVALLLTRKTTRQPNCMTTASIWKSKFEALEPNGGILLNQTGQPHKRCLEAASYQTITWPYFHGVGNL